MIIFDNYIYHKNYNLKKTRFSPVHTVMGVCNLCTPFLVEFNDDTITRNAQ